MVTGAPHFGGAQKQGEKMKVLYVAADIAWFPEVASSVGYYLRSQRRDNEETLLVGIDDNKVVWEASNYREIPPYMRTASTSGAREVALSHAKSVNATSIIFMTCWNGHAQFHEENRN